MALKREELPERLQELLNDKGELPAIAWPGGYPIVYYDKCGNTLCPKCASRDVDSGQAVQDYDAHWEGAPLVCDDCGAEIESAYGDPDAPEEQDAGEQEETPQDVGELGGESGRD